MKESTEIAKMHHELERLEKVAYDTYCDLEVAIDALSQISEKPEKAAEIARWALNIIHNKAETQVDNT